MSAITDNFNATAAAWVIDKRLTYHTGSGKSLDGLNYDTEGTLKVDGEDDLPLLQPWSINIVENLWAGAPVSGSTAARGNINTVESLDLTFRFATTRKNGWFRRDPTDSSASKGFLEWLALVRDAIEDTAASSPVADARLLQTLHRPLTISVGDSETSELTFQSYITVSCDLLPYCRGQRANNFPTTTG